MKMLLSHDDRSLMILPRPPGKLVKELMDSCPAAAELLSGSGEETWETSFGELIKAMKTVHRELSDITISEPLASLVCYQRDGRSFGFCRGCTGFSVDGQRGIAHVEGQRFILKLSSGKSKENDLTGLITLFVDDGRVDIKYKKKGDMFVSAIRSLQNWVPELDPAEVVTLSRI